MATDREGQNIQSALQGIKKGASWGVRLVYGVYFLLGLGLLGLSVVLLYLVSFGVLNISVAPYIGVYYDSVVATLYAIIGYGFLFCRKWIVTALTAGTLLLVMFGALLLVGPQPTYGFFLLTKTALIFAVLTTGVVTTRRLLSGSYIHPVLAVFLVLVVYTLVFNMFRV